MSPGILGILAVLAFGLGVYDARRLSRAVRFAALALAAVVIVVLCIVARDPDTGSDIAAFYCAGHALLTHQSPALAASLEPCERSLLTPWTAVFPSPQPAYDLAAFALLALLPFPWANALWYLAVAVSIAVATLALRRITGIPCVPLVAAQALTLGVTSIELGQLAPMAFACIALAALGLREDRPRLAAIAGAGALVLPHAGLPLVVAVAIAAPRARFALALACAALAAVALLTLGVAWNIDYFTRALPLHALAESANAEQYSFTMLAHVAGAGDRLAGILGFASYAFMFVLGQWLGLRTARATGDRSFAGFVPVAAVLLGGTFLHASELQLALGAALVLAARSERFAHAAGRASVVVLALPWNTVPYRLLFVVAGATIVAITLGLPPAGRVRARLLLAATTLAAYVVILWGVHRLPSSPIRIAGDAATFRAQTRALERYASVPWGLLLRGDRRYTDTSVAILAAKVPAWLALVLILGAALSLSGMKPRSSPERSNP